MQQADARPLRPEEAPIPENENVMEQAAAEEFTAEDQADE